MEVERVPIPPGFLTTWCNAHAHGTEHPPEAFLASGLAVMAATCGPRLNIRWSATHTERANLWIMVAARSALGGKTTTSSALTWGLRRVGAVLGADEVRRMPLDRFSDADILHELDVLGQDTARAEAEEKRMAKAEGRDPDPVSVPERRPPVGFVMVINELAQLWGGDIPKHHDQARTTLLSVYDGHISSSTRATKVKPQDCCVSAIGNIPVSELAKRTEISTLRSGFAGRWFMVPMPDPVRHIATPRVGGDDHLLAAAMATDDLARMAKETRDDGVDCIAVMLEEGGDADKARDAWYTSTRSGFLTDTGADELDEAGQEIYQRLQSTALKLAIYSATSRQVESGHSLAAVRIAREDVLWGQLVVDHSRAALLGAVRPTVGTIEDKITAALRNGLGATSEEAAVTASALRRKVARDMRSQDFMRTCAALYELGEIGMKDLATGGRPSTMVWVDG